ncbi:hypothetical protein AAKU67_000493 [Oxalobacteraceae bacterium GrIS 2.11]
MKSSLKIIVAALALATAGGAFAVTPVVNTPQITAATGTDLLFYAYDANAGVETAFVEDLGITYSNFQALSPAAQASKTFAVTSSSAWSTYVTKTLALASGAGFTYANGLTNTTWGVMAGVAKSTTLQGVSLTVNNTDAPKAEDVGRINSVETDLGNLVGKAGLSGTNNRAALLAGVYDTQAVTNYWTDGKKSLDFQVTNNIGESSAFANYNSAGVDAGQVTPTIYGNAGGASSFLFDGTSLKYTVAQVAAVPEPSSYAMMLGGLLMIGALAIRRRNSK